MSQLCEWALNFCPGLSVRIAQFTGNKKPALLNAVFMELRGRSGQDVCGEVSRIRTARLRYFVPALRFIDWDGKGRSEMAVIVELRANSAKGGI
jgi:hypothetical protein